ncbi:hypothetical protein GMMP1_1220025 [Candidatus Magnetomoraceae bacterium gMMP-1]
MRTYYKEAFNFFILINYPKGGNFDEKIYSFVVCTGFYLWDILDCSGR